MELFIFARFHAREVMKRVSRRCCASRPDCAREEQGCLAIQAYRSIRDPRLFYIHSRWTDEAAFEVHAELPRTVQFASGAAR